MHPRETAGVNKWNQGVKVVYLMGDDNLNLGLDFGMIISFLKFKIFKSI